MSQVPETVQLGPHNIPLIWSAKSCHETNTEYVKTHAAAHEMAIDRYL